MSHYSNYGYNDFYSTGYKQNIIRKFLKNKNKWNINYLQSKYMTGGGLKD